MKKNTAFIKRLRTAINASSQSQFLQEIRTLSLHKYLSEIISACYEGLCKLKTPGEIATGVEIVSALHQRFGSAEFTGYIGWYIGRGLATPDKAHLKALSQEVRDQEVNAVPQPQAGGGVTELYRFEGQTGRSGVLWGGIANASTLLGRNTRISLNNTYNRSADNEARQDVGFSENLNTTLERSTLRFVERTIRSNQLMLEQQLPKGQSLDLALTSAGVTRKPCWTR